MTKKEKYWIMYDVGNSAFIMLVTAILPIYFKNMAEVGGIEDSLSTAYWGYATSISTLIIAVLGPICGTIGDFKGYKKKLFITFAIIGIIFCGALSVASNWIWFIIIYIIAKAGYSGSLIFYDAMLNDVSTDERLDIVSSHGYAWGYIGSCIPFIISLGIILTAEKTGIGTINATKIAFILNALWWLLFTLPLLKIYQQKYYVPHSDNIIKSSFGRLYNTLKDVKKEKGIATFLLSFFLYIDGVYTIIEMATSYGKDVGISDNNLLLALLLTQVVAFPCAILFGKLSYKKDVKIWIKYSIIGYLLISLFALQLDKAWEFWFLAVCVGTLQGGIQALSRSYYAKIIPKDKTNEYFGFYDIFGKGAAFTGTFLVGIASQITGDSRYGVAIISLLFILGIIMFNRHTKYMEKN